MKILGSFGLTAKVSYTGLLLLCLILLGLVLGACGPSTPTATRPAAVAATEVVASPTETATVAPSATAVAGPTATPVPPTNSPVPTPTTVAPTPSPAVEPTTAPPTAQPTQAKPTTTMPPPTPTIPVKATVGPTALAFAGTIVPSPTEVLKRSVILEPMVWEAQTMNNCGPMSALMALSHFGLRLTQNECGRALRPNSSDRMTRPDQLVSFVQSKGFKSVLRENGSPEILRALLSAGVPVITMQWVKDGDDVGHYRVARGYDLASNVFIYNDALERKPNLVLGAALHDKLWKGFDRRYMPVYTTEQEAKVMEILGQDADTGLNLFRAREVAQHAVETGPRDVDAWTNLGYLYSITNDCPAAVAVWEQQVKRLLRPSSSGPYNRFLWYTLWPLKCYNQLANYGPVLNILPNELAQTQVYAEGRYEYAVALLNTGRKSEAVSQLKRALLDDANYSPIYELLAQLGVK